MGQKDRRRNGVSRLVNRRGCAPSPPRFVRREQSRRCTTVNPRRRVPPALTRSTRQADGANGVTSQGRFLYLCSRTDSTGKLAHDLRCRLLRTQRDKGRMTEHFVARPSGEANLATKFGFTHRANRRSRAGGMVAVGGVLTSIFFSRACRPSSSLTLKPVHTRPA